MENMMAGSTFGNTFKITTWGESHGKAIGVVIDGCPAGLPLNEDDIQRYLNRRKPGQSEYTTPRKEDDTATILSGLFEGRTTGTPISLVVYNRSARSADYSHISNLYRPGHADYTFDCKYGFRDYRGGGRSSGRETIGRVAAGAVALKILKECKINIQAYTKSIGSVTIDYRRFDSEEILRNPLYMPDSIAYKEAVQLLKAKIQEQDSIGGIIECTIDGMPAGIGEPVFDKLDANLAKAMLSIGAVKGFEIGEGFNAARLCGSDNNDGFILDDNEAITKASNHSGGTLGGLSDGSTIVFKVAVKPTPSIGKNQKTVNKNNEEIGVNIRGRHDPIIVPRAVVVVESMAALTIVDLLLSNMSARMDNIKKFYSNFFN